MPDMLALSGLEWLCDVLTVYEKARRNTAGLPLNRPSGSETVPSEYWGYVTLALMIVPKWAHRVARLRDASALLI